MKTSLNLENFFIFEPAKKDLINSKLAAFVAAGKNKIHVILDFDRTITSGQDATGKDLTVWGLLKALLSPKAQAKYDKLYDRYRNLEIKNKLSETDAINWWELILILYKENKIKLSDIKREVNKMRLRPYAREMFRICDRKNIPTIIISAGIRNVIELICKKAGIFPTTILSTALTFSPEGYINTWQRDSLIHILNKKERGHKEIEAVKSARPDTILVGDSLDDASMVEGQNNVLRVAVYDQRADGRQGQLKKFAKKFDLIVKEQTLYPIIKILRLF